MLQVKKYIVPLTDFEEGKLITSPIKRLNMPLNNDLPVLFCLRICFPCMIATVLIYPLNIDHQEKEKRSSKPCSQSHLRSTKAYMSQKTAESYYQSPKKLYNPLFPPKNSNPYPQLFSTAFLLPLPSFPIFPIIRIHRKPLLIANPNPNFIITSKSSLKMGKFYVTISNNCLKYKVCK